MCIPLYLGNYLLCVNTCLHMYLCTTYVWCLPGVEECWILWNWGYRCLSASVWIWISNLGPLERTGSEESVSNLWGPKHVFKKLVCVCACGHALNIMVCVEFRLQGFFV